MSSEKPETNHQAWYVVHTKPRQEARALENLQNQGFNCFLPTMQVQKLRNQKVQVITEPMFSRYLFIQLDDATQDWSPIRSTLGVSKLVSFGPLPAKVPIAFVVLLQNAPQAALERMFTLGDSVRITNGPMHGLEGQYIAHDGETRAFVLVDMLGQPQKLRIAIDSLRVVK